MMPKVNIEQFFCHSRRDWEALEKSLVQLTTEAMEETGGSRSLERLAEILPFLFARVQSKIELCERLCLELADVPDVE